MPTKNSAREPAKQLDDLIQQVVESEAFRAAPMMRTLLMYLWKRQGESINEYSIAVDALGRPPDFDPKTDSTVRVQIARLRAKLKEFYEAAGDSFPLRLSIPLGRYELHAIRNLPPASAWNPIRALPLRYRVSTAVLVALLAVACAVLFLQNRALKAELASSAPLPRFWRVFLQDGKPTVVVVPSPLYVTWPEHKVYIRDLTISEFTKWPASPLLHELGQKWGPPALSQIYVGALEMTASVKILQYLERAGQPVQLIESRKFSPDSFAEQNTIFLGMPRTAIYLDQLLEKTNFYISQVEPDIVRNRKPGPGEPVDFKEVPYSPDRRVSPAIIIFLPTRPERTRSLLLMGRIPTTMASMLLSLDGLKLVDEAWAKGGSPDAWEMVIQAEVYRDTILKYRPVAFRSIPGTFWK